MTKKRVVKRSVWEVHAHRRFGTVEYSFAQATIKMQMALKNVRPYLQGNLIGTQVADLMKEVDFRQYKVKAQQVASGESNQHKLIRNLFKADAK